MDGTSFVAKAANMAARKGMLVCNSMGNEADDKSWRVLITPADADSVISVGGIESSLDNYRHIDFSSYGPTADGRRKPNVTAFGHAFVADPKGDITSAYGTSFSCPLVAGFCACAWQTHRELTAMQLKDEIEKSGDLYPYFDYALGYGVPQASYFTGEATTATEPTFNFEQSGNTLNIKLKPYDKNTEVFYNIMREDGYLFYYEHIDATGEGEINIRNINDFPNSTINVYYHGYVGSFENKASVDGRDSYSRLPIVGVDGCTKQMYRSDYNTNREYNKPKITRFLVMVDAGFAGVKTFEGTTNKQKSTYSAMLGFQWETCKKYYIGAGLGLGCDDYWGSNLVGVSYSNVIRERFRTSNMNLELFQRVKLVSGGLMSNGFTWDLGVFGSWNFENRHVVIMDAISPDYSRTRMTNKNYNFVNPLQWGVKTAFTYDIVSVYAKLRISDLLNDSYAGPYNDYMKLEIGMQLIVPF